MRCGRRGAWTTLAATIVTISATATAAAAGDPRWVATFGRGLFEAQSNDVAVGADERVLVAGSLPTSSGRLWFGWPPAYRLVPVGNPVGRARPALSYRLRAGASGGPARTTVGYSAAGAHP